MKISTYFCVGLLALCLSTHLQAQTNYTIDQTGMFNFMFAPGDTVILADEEISNALPIGFSFSFYDSTYTQFYVGSNGFITFTPTTNTGCCTGQMIPNTAQPNNLIAFAWNNLDPSAGGTVTYTTDGIAPNRILRVTFFNVAHFNNPFAPVTSQVALYEGTNIIEIHTASMPGTGTAHTMGLENGNGTRAVPVPLRNASSWSAAADVVKFTPFLQVADDAGVTALSLPGFCAGSQAVTATVKNFGATQINSVVVNWEFNGVAQTPVNYTTTIDTLGGVGADSAFVTLGNVSLIQGQTYNLRAWTSAPNMNADPNPANDTSRLSFSSGLPAGTYTIGGSSPDYANWQAAVSELNAIGVCGPVIFNVRTGVYAESIEVGEITGASASNTITFQSESGDSTDVVLTFASTGGINQTLLLNGAQYLVFQNLTIRNTGTSFQANAVALEGGASYNRFLHTVLEGPVATFAVPQLAVVYSSPGVGNTDNANYNLFHQNRVLNGAYGFYLGGFSLTPGNREVGHQIRNNQILEPYGGGIVISSSDSVEIMGNEIQISTGANNAKGIELSFIYDELELASNRLILNDGQGIRFFGTNGTVAHPLQVYNNFISLSGSQATAGLEVVSAIATNFLFNNINMSGGGAASTAISLDASVDSCEIKNNIFVNTSGGYAITDDNTTSNSLDYNNYFTTGGPIAARGSAYTSLLAWQLATMQDSNSLSVDPLFTSATDLHVSKGLLNGAGTPIASITTDIDGELRNNPPDIGADEFMPAAAYDVNVAAILYPQAPFGAGNYPVQAVIKNAGSNALTALTIQWSINNSIQGTLPWSGNLALGQADTIQLGSVTLADGQSYELEVRAELPLGLTNADPSDDILLVEGIRTALLGVYTLGGSNPDFSNFSAAAEALSSGGVLGAVTFLVRSGLYEEQIRITEFPGSSCQNPVVFRSQSGDSSQVFLQHAATDANQNYVLQLDGADGISFVSMTLRTRDTAFFNFQRIVEIKGGASCNTFDDIHFLGIPTNSGSDNRALVFSEEGTLNDTANTFQNSLFEYGSIGMELSGVDFFDQAKGTRIHHNTFLNQYEKGISLQYQEQVEITENTISSLQAGNLSYSGLDLIGSRGASIIEKNKIEAAEGSGIAISASAGTASAPGRLVNNFVSVGGNSQAFGIIFVSSDQWDILHNSVHIYSTDALGGRAFYKDFSGTGLRLTNNVFANSGGGYAVYIGTSTYGVADYNDLYTSGTNLGFFGSNRTNLAAWQAATSQDANSVAVNPLFVSNTDLHIQGSALDSLATPLASVLEDIDGESRDMTNPDIGADEFSFLPDEIGVLAILSPQTGCALGQADSVTIRIANFGSNTQSGFNVAFVFDGQAPVVENVGSLSIAAGQTAEFTFQTASLNLSAFGSYSLLAYTSLQGDQDNSNDSLATSISNFPAFSIQITGDSSICSGDGANLEASTGGNTYSWSDGNTGRFANVSPASSSTYVVTATNLNGCVATDSFRVSVAPTPPRPTISASGPLTVCNGDSVVLTSSIGGTIQWSTGDTSISIIVRESGAYRVTNLSTINQCNATSNAANISISKDSISTSGIPVICQGNAITLSATNALTASWSNGSMSNPISVNPTQTTTYWVNATTSAGCSFTDTVTITVTPFSQATPITNAFPPDGSLNQSLPLRLSWLAGNNTLLYDVYLWQKSGSRPGLPNSSNQTNIDYTATNLKDLTSYYWQVASKNACTTVFSDTFEFKTIGLPDLTIDTFSSPVSGTAGQQISVSWTVNNQGIAGTGSRAWKDYVYISSDESLLESEDILLGSFANPGFLNPGQSYTQSKTVTLPISLSGSYYFFITTDNADAFCNSPTLQCFPGAMRLSTRNNMAESDESNNWVLDTLLINPAPVPDLQVVSVGAPTAAFSGDDITVTYLVENRGVVKATGGWRDFVYLSPDSVFNLSNATLIKQNIISNELDVDSSYTIMSSGQVPYSFFGTYWVHVVTDQPDDVYEQPFDDNNTGTAVASLQVTLTPPPDLAVTSLAVSPASLFSGQSLTVDWTVTNQGINPSPTRTWQDEVFISLLDTFNRDSAISLGTVFYTNGQNLGNGDNYSRSQTLSLPVQLSGNYYVYVFTDTRDRVFEFTNEANNIRRSLMPVAVTQTPYADLVISDIQLPVDTMFGGFSYLISWTVKNQGTGPATGGWKDDVFLSIINVAASTFGTSGGSFSNSHTLAAGDSITITTNWVAPNINGNYFFIVGTDVDDDHYEYQFEQNNKSVVTDFGGRAVRFIPTAAGGPPQLINLEARQIAAPDTAANGDRLNLVATGRNLGPAPVQLYQLAWKDGLYLSADSIWDPSDTLLDKINIYTALDTGDTYLASFSVQIPYGVDGDLYLLYAVDADTAVSADTLRMNNVVSRRIHIEKIFPPDLSVTQFSFPDTLYAGQFIDFPYEVTNVGTGPATSGDNWTDLVFLSNSPSSSPLKIPLGRLSQRGPLGTGVSYEDTVRGVVPSYLNGNYFLLITTNDRQRVYEDSVNNNTLSFPVLVLPNNAYAGDLVVSDIQFADSVLLGMEDTVRFELKNTGSQPLSGRVQNAFYFSQDNIFDGALDPLFELAAEPLNLAPGDSIQAEIIGKSKELNAGNYQGILRANTTASVPERSLTNNDSVIAPIHIDAKELMLAVPDSADLNLGDFVYYKVDVGAGLDLLITLSSNQPSGINEVWVAYGRTPVSTNFDFQNLNPVATNQQVLVPNTQAGTYYIYAQTQTPFGTPQRVEVLAEALPFSILSINPDRVGRGMVTTQLSGAGFRPGVQIELRDTMGATVSNAQIKTYLNSMQLELRWDLTAVPVGLYDVVAINPDMSEVSLVKGLEVEESTGLEMGVYSTSPNAIRAERQAVFNYVFENIGNIDVPYAKGEIGFLRSTNLVEITVSGDVFKLTDLIDTTVLESDDWIELDIYKFIPLIGKDLAPGERFFVNLTFKDFLYAEFPIRARVKSYTTELFAQEQARFAESSRQATLNNQNRLQAYPDLLALANDPIAFRDSVFQVYYDQGIMDSMEIAGVALDSCINCENNFNFSPGSSPGTQNLPDTVFGPGGNYLWEINHPYGAAGQDPGWDLLKINGRLDVTATAQDPFSIIMSSLSSYDNEPDFLTTWSPGYDISWPIVTASGGIFGFDTMKVKLDSTLFAVWNETYGGFFYLELQGTDSLFLKFQARVPDIGQNGIPGGPGQPGQPGGNGGPGGMGDGSTPPGDGGQGGEGGTGVPSDLAWDGNEVPPGPGGDGGPGGMGGSGQDGGSGGEGGDGGQAGPGQTGGPGGNGGPGGTGGNGGNGGSGGDGGTGGGGDSGGPGGGPGPGGSGGGGGGFGGPGGGFGGGGSPGGGYNPNSPSGPNGPNGPGAPGLGPVECETDSANRKRCEDFWRQVGCGTTGFGCAEDLVKYTLGGALAGAGWGAIAGATYATFKCGLGIFNCATGGTDLTNGIGCVTGVIDVGLGDATGAVNCAAYLCEAVPVVKSCDPNEIVGPPGYGKPKWVSVNDELDYTIFYENDPEFATTAALRVTIRQELDPDVNPASFSLGEFGFSNMTFQVPANRTTYSTVLNLEDSIGVDVEVTGGLDFVNNEIFWVFQSIDPATGLPPYDPFAGYLPVNDSTGIGEGFVKYIISPQSSAQTGDTVAAQASIVFDVNAAIVTNNYKNVIDAYAPASRLDSIPANVDSVFSITVDANDDTGGVGASSFDLYVSENNGPYTLFAQAIPVDSAYEFTGNPGSGYCMFSRAIDWVRNAEPLKTQPDWCFVYQLPGEISLLQPQGGESYCTGDTLTAIWTAEDVDFVNLYYSVDSGQTYTEIELNRLASDSVFQWVLPDSLMPSNDYFFKVVSDQYPSLFRENELPFAIYQKPATPMLTAPMQSMYCDGDTVTLEGPLGYAIYHWSNGDTTRTIKVAQSGNYSLRVENEDGCESLESNIISLTFNPLPAQPAITTLSPTTFCLGDSTRLAGPVGFAQYLWSNSASGDTITVNASGSVTLQVVDVNGCASPVSAAVSTTVNPLPAQPVIMGALDFCQGSFTQLSTNFGFASYNWSNGGTDSVITVNTAQTLTVSVTDNNGCESPLSAPVTTVVNPLPPQATILPSGPTTFCEGDSVILSGPAGYSTYNWSNGGFGSSTVIDSTVSVTLSLVDANSCEGPVSQAINIVVNPLPVQPVISNISPTSFCDGDSTQLAGPTGFAQYIWSNNAMGDTIFVTTAGNISLQVIDANGCSSPASAAVGVIVNPLPPRPVITGDSSFCQGDSTVLGAPAGFVAYNWSNGETDSVITVNSAQALTVFVTDANGCISPLSARRNITVNALPAQPTITAGGSLSFCEGDDVMLSGPAGFVAYNWSNGASGASIRVDSTVSVTLAVIDAVGCESPLSAPVMTVVNPLPAQPAITANGATTFCQGDSVILSGPMGFAGYVWSNGDTSRNTVIKVSANLTLSVVDTNSCESPVSTQTLVTVNALPIPVISPGDTAICDDESLVLRTQQAYAAYTWSDGSTADSLLVTQSGTYAVSVVDANMCEGESVDSVEVTVLAVPAKPAIMKVGTDSLMATTSGTSYQWFVDGVQLAPTTQLIMTAQNGQYTVIVFNGPCASEASDSLLINTGLDDLLDGVAVQLFPNPNSGIFEIRADFRRTTFVTAQLFTADGKVIFDRYIHAEQGRLREKVALPNLASGMYLLRLRVNNDYLLRKVEILR